MSASISAFLLKENKQTKKNQPALLDFLLSKSSRYINEAVVYMNPLTNVSSLFISGTVNKLRKGKDKN